jgi:hypothetical protein
MRIFTVHLHSLQDIVCMFLADFLEASADADLQAYSVFGKLLSVRRVEEPMD